MSIAAVSSGLAQAISNFAKPAPARTVDRDTDYDRNAPAESPAPRPSDAKRMALNILV